MSITTTATTTTRPDVETTRRAAERYLQAVRLCAQFQPYVESPDDMTTAILNERRDAEDAMVLTVKAWGSASIRLDGRIWTVPPILPVDECEAEPERQTIAVVDLATVLDLEAIEADE